MNSRSDNFLPLVSIVTPTYNQGKYIEATIQSVLSQNYSNVEYIVVDGGSTDETLDILKRYDKRLRWISEHDNGPEDAINKGIRQTRGKIVAWLASDDTYLPETITTAVEIFRKHPSVGLVYGKSRYIDSTGMFIADYPTAPFNDNAMAVYNIICQPSVFFLRDIFFDAGELSLDLEIATDYDLWIRIANLSSIFYIPQYLSNYRLHYDAKTLGYSDPLVKFEECLNIAYKYYRWAPANRVYPCCLYRLKEKSWKLPSFLITQLALLYALYEYLRLNKGIDHRDLALIPRNLKKLLFGWELEDTIKSENKNL